jgi:RNA recognition motif-containing protein
MRTIILHGAGIWCMVIAVESFVLPVLGRCHSGIPTGQRQTTQKRFDLRQRIARFLLFSNISVRFSMTKLYVGNLSFDTTEESLRALFSEYGSVESAKLVSDRDTGRPRGFGFVEMASADASSAMQALNGKDFEGRTLRVNEAQSVNRSDGRNAAARRY